MSSTQPAASSFTPRKEFLRVPRQTKNSFALLAFSGPNGVRLRSFIPQTVHQIRRVLEQYAPILAVIEDPPNNVCEFTVDKKPWANPRSVPSEKLLVDILAAVYQFGYAYLSTMDYGREADDRLVMVFSKSEPAAPLISKSAALQPPTLMARNESSTSSLAENLSIKRVPFAISFSSTTVMRVISPPLHLTPAILQACRGAWPRGVISEKTIHGNSYEFKLKGYGLFEQDTFVADSLQHILALLSSLDAQSFSLMASISLTNRSRIKDLWLFTAPAPEDTPSDLLEIRTSESSALRRYSFPPGHVDPQRKNQTTELSPSIPHSPLAGHHNKSSSEGSQRRALVAAQQTNLLRKAIPRAQVPVDVRNSEIFHRTYLPSIISAGAIDMTGVGSGQTLDAFDETLPSSPGTSAQHNHIAAPVPVPSTIRRAGSTPPRSAGRVKTPPPLVSGGWKHPISQKEPVAEQGSAAPLLGSTVFRDSSMTSDTEMTREIPIKWTGPLIGDWDAGDKTKAKENLVADTGVIPGGWPTFPSPIAEQGEGVDGEELTERRETPILNNESRVEAPEFVQPTVELKKSEAALVGMIKSTSPPPKESPQAGGNGKGWVLVNVEDSPGSPEQTPQTPDSCVECQPKTASAEAKAIVVVDVLNSKKKVPTGGSKDGDLSVKRLFTLARKNSVSMEFI